MIISAWWRLTGCRLLMLAMALFASTSGRAIAPKIPILSESEQVWVAHHPVVRYAIDPDWKPLEYIDGNRHMGLTRDYLDQLTVLTGIRFVLVPTRSWLESLDALASGQVDMLPGVPKLLSGAQPLANAIYSRPYYTGETLVVTRADTPVVAAPEALAGRLVAVQAGGVYERWLRGSYPAVKLVTYADIASTLEAVHRGDAYAAIGVDALVHPLLRQRYATLHIAGIVTDFPLVLRMAVQSELPMLQEVLDRGLSSLSAEENDRIYAQWLEAADYGAPSFGALTRYYGAEIFLGAMVLLIALLAAWQAKRTGQAAQLAEHQKSLFLAMMSHEIRNPMHTILSAIELLDKKLVGKEEQKLLAAASSASGQLFGLLGDILDYSRLEAKKLELAPVPTDTLRVVRDAILQVDQAARQKGLSTPLIAPPELPAVMVDPVRLRQIVSNLLSNAVKFTSVGSVMTSVSLSHPAGMTEVARLNLEVRDTGPGMSQAVLQRIFRPFVQGSPSVAGQHGGTGLGLSICRALVDMMGGQIEVQSRMGEGTQVRVELPLLLARGAHPTVEFREVSIRRFSGVRALVVEDEPLNQYILAAQLGTLGVAAEVRGTGEDALTAFREHDFAVVFLDCQLPDIDGYEVARRIRHHEKSEGLPPTPVVSVSANSGSEHQQRCQECGIDIVLSKPLGLAELGRVLEQHVTITPGGVRSEAHGIALPVEIFLASVEADLQAFDQSLDQGNFAHCAELAHRIKGAALVAGDTAFANAARAAEAAAHGDRQSELRASLANLWELFGQMDRSRDEGQENPIGR
ncbi:hybrid sensor histidine kinase/response regulator [Paraburkholderia caffeinilytica]|uniref:hybrid sensor histidine kinase/response regulator n=1 Tax=Paraburkholderia caffeinilytica TaxID=1761016 RepID=UPI003DA16B78